MFFLSQCSIDLKKSSLLISTTGTETQFLPEAELPECARLAYGAEGREDARPDEIADRELAEALQRSVQESGKELYTQREGVCGCSLSSAHLACFSVDIFSAQPEKITFACSIF